MLSYKSLSVFINFVFINALPFSVFIINTKLKINIIFGAKNFHCKNSDSDVFFINCTIYSVFVYPFIHNRLTIKQGIPPCKIITIDHV